MTKIACLGDIMCGDSFYALGMGAGSSIDKYGVGFMPQDVRSLLAAHEIVFGNVECPLSDVGRRDHVLRTLHMRGRAQTAGYLASWGLSVANLANNHIFEHGRQVALDTAHNLEQAGIATTGSGHDAQFDEGLRTAEIRSAGTTFAFLGICLREEKYAFAGGAALAQVVETVRELRAQGKVVCVSAHWGDEFIDRPSLSQRRIGRALVEAGASLVMGHHPHVVQGIEFLGGGLIAYSLGNFIFDSFLEPTRRSFILSVTLAEAAVVGWECIPIYLDSEHRPRLAQAPRKVELDSEIKRRCELLSGVFDQEYESQYSQDVAVLNARFRRELRRTLLSRWFRMNPVFWPQILCRPIQRRLGLW